MPLIPTRLRSRLAFGLMLATGTAGSAWAVPPAPGTPAAQELDAYTAEEKAWIGRQHNKAGRFCCSEGDFDFVRLRQNGDKMQAQAKHPDPAKGIPPGWLDIEEERMVDLKGQKNVPDVLAAWYYNGHIQCIIMGGGY